MYACLFEAVCDVTTVPSHLNSALGLSTASTSARRQVGPHGETVELVTSAWTINRDVFSLT